MVVFGAFRPGALGGGFLPGQSTTGTGVGGVWVEGGVGVFDLLNQGGFSLFFTKGGLYDGRGGLGVG